MSHRNIPYSFSERQIKTAKKRAKTPKDFTRTIDSASRVYGCLAEIAFSNIFPDAKWRGDSDYDYLLNGYKIEIKACACSNFPKPYFQASVEKRPDHLGIQKCDFFVFVRVLYTRQKCWICGFISREDFIKTSKFYKKGDSMPNMKDGEFKNDCYIIYHHQLKPFKKRNF